MQYPPMLAQKISRVPEGAQWLIEPKYDGWRALAHIDTSTHLETRTGTAITQVPYLAAALTALACPGTILDGEIVDLCGGAQWNRTQTILSTTRSAFTHQPGPQDPPLTYMLFDALAIAGSDLRDRPLRERRALLAQLLRDIAGHEGGVLALAASEPAIPQAASRIISAGFEGVVIKHRDSRYACGARGGGAWYKLKPDAEVEAICTGTYPATPGSKYAPPDHDGRPQPWAVGGLCFRVTHADGRVYDGRAAGMDDELRRALHEHPERYIGLIVEIAHRGIAASGSLRHPQFKRFRTSHDKPAASTLPLALEHDPPQSTSAIQAVRPVRSTTSPKPGVALGGKRRMRNYQAMSDAKLRACLQSLRSRTGEPYERCLASGSADPDADLAQVERHASRRGLC